MASAVASIYPRNPENWSESAARFPSAAARVILFRNRTGLESEPEDAQARLQYQLATERLRGRGLGCNSYLRRKWQPRVGPTFVALVEALRAHCYVDREAGEVRDVWCISHAQLAQALGRSVSTVQRTLRHPEMHRFVQWAPRRRYDPAGQRSVVTSCYYLVSLTDPLTPEDALALEEEVARHCAPPSFVPTDDRLNASAERPSQRSVKTPAQSSPSEASHSLDEENSRSPGTGSPVTIGRAAPSAADHRKSDTETEQDRRGAALAVVTRSRDWAPARRRLQHHLVDHCHDKPETAQRSVGLLLAHAHRLGCPPHIADQLVEEAWSRVYSRAGVLNKAAYLMKVYPDVLAAGKLLAWDASRVSAKYQEQQRRMRRRRK